ncbi:hypothetical protein [Anatilimnocola floriformis]|uniref:hypothetical protein n=1 Tax=Anatilimnocola floriformis TaxID=2948575 RepID=UPI0020C2876A|nr:hypothetical protein [Anatilimnocola floriformis]
MSAVARVLEKGDDMTVHPSVRGFWFAFLVLLGGAFAAAQEELPPEIDSDGVQTLTRGPVHEAFAAPAVADAKPGLTVPKPPPADIREQPPEYQPEGQNVQWFPGYWAWDEDRDDYIWISGAWRDPPPGQRWVPGYWAEVPGGFQWVSGFWINDQIEEMQYRPAPPVSLEQGPSVASPGDDYFYIPGSWNYVNNDYVWSAGYYAPYREDWIYVQPHWVWTPRGYVYIAGYWDWRLPRRGQIFAPVYMQPVVYARPTYYYTPRCVINTSNLFVHLWVRDSYCHYYFGNYYGPTYVNRSFTPWCNYNARPHCHDPLFSYCNVHYHRQGINYAQRMQGWHNHYVSHVDQRPANTWRDQIAHQHDHRDIRNPNGGPQVRPASLGEDLKDIVRKPEYRWTKQDLVSKDYNKKAIEQVKELHNMRLKEEHVSFVPGGRDQPGRGNDRPDRDPSDRPNRGPAIGDPGKGPDVKLPGKPGNDTPADKIAATQDVLTSKFRLPKAPTANLSPNKPKIEAPEKPDRNVVSRPIDRNPLDLNPGERNPGDRNPLDRKPIDRIPGDKTNVGDKPLVNGNKPDGKDPTRLPGRNNGILPPGLVPSVDKPANTGLDTPLTKPTDKPNDKPLTNREPRKPDLGGAANPTNNALQQKIDALKQQQQDAINKARQPRPDLGGNPTRTIETPKVNTPKVDLTQKVDTTPKVDRTPKFEVPKREANPPRNLGGSGMNPGGNGGINLGGNKETKPFNVPKPNVERTQPSRQNNIQNLQPRNSTPAPRTTTPKENNNSGNQDKEKKRGR